MHFGAIFWRQYSSKYTMRASFIVEEEMTQKMDEVVHQIPTEKNSYRWKALSL